VCPAYLLVADIVDGVKRVASVSLVAEIKSTEVM
jgi:hypothetical protein